MTATAIIVSPFFPPATLAGVHRARHLAKHLPATGWRPVVVCVDERHHEERLDPDLARLLPGGIETIKVAALPSRLMRPVGIGDLGLRGYAALRSAVYRSVRSNPGAVVLITGAPFYPMLMAQGLSRAGIPVVLDFQDPWVSAWGGRQPRWSKAGLSHRLAVGLEPRALGGASFVTSVSETQNAEMAARYPWLDARRMAAIPIGGDPEDFERLRSMNVALSDDALDPAKVNLSFVGTFMPRSGPLVRLVLVALARLRREAPDVGNRVRLNFVGTSNQPGDRTTHRVLPIAQEAGVAEAVREIPERRPYLEALAVLARSDGILLIGSDEAHYTASKIYPAMMCGRPFLSLFHVASSSHAILKAAGGGMAHAFADGRPEADLVRDLAASLARLATDPGTLGRVDPAAYAASEARAVARRYAGIFEQVAANG